MNRNPGLLERHAAARGLLSPREDSTSTLLDRLPSELRNYIFNIAMPRPLHPILAHRDPAVAIVGSQSVSAETRYIPHAFVYEVLDSVGGQCFITSMDDSVVNKAVDEFLDSVPPEAVVAAASGARDQNHRAAPAHSHPIYYMPDNWRVHKVENEYKLSSLWNGPVARYVGQVLAHAPQHPNYYAPLVRMGRGMDMVCKLWPKYLDAIVLIRAAFKMPDVLTAQRLAALADLLKSLGPDSKVVVSLVEKKNKNKDKNHSNNRNKNKPKSNSNNPKPKPSITNRAVWRPPFAATHEIKYALTDGTAITDEDTVSALHMVLDSICCPVDNPSSDIGSDAGDFGANDENLYPHLVAHALLSNGRQYVFVACDYDRSMGNKMNPKTPTISVSSTYGTPYTPHLNSGTNELVPATAAFPTPLPAPRAGWSAVLRAGSPTLPSRPCCRGSSPGLEWPGTFDGIYTLKLGGEGLPPLSIANAFAAWAARAIRDLAGSGNK